MHRSNTLSINVLHLSCRVISKPSGRLLPCAIVVRASRLQGRRRPRAGAGAGAGWTWCMRVGERVLVLEGFRGSGSRARGVAMVLRARRGRRAPLAESRWWVLVLLWASHFLGWEQSPPYPPLRYLVLASLDYPRRLVSLAGPIPADPRLTGAGRLAIGRCPRVVRLVWAIGLALPVLLRKPPAKAPGVAMSWHPPMTRCGVPAGA